MASIPVKFLPAINSIIEKEVGPGTEIDPVGGYTDDPSDRGGETRWGIIKSVWRANGYSGPILQAPRSLAETIYFNRYISIPQFDRVSAVNYLIAYELIDTGVNMGPAIAAMFLQRWLNSFNFEGVLGGDLFCDGRIGPQTIQMLKNYLHERGELGVTVLLKALNGVQANRYLEITEANKTQRKYSFGWIAGRT